MRKESGIISDDQEKEPNFQCKEIMINNHTSIDELESLREGQWVLDEHGKSSLLLEIEIKKYKIEKHIYIKLSSIPKTILIIR